jgi:hypothetical protein
MMQAGLHAIGWGMQRLAITLVGLVLAVIFAYITLVFVIVAVQAVGALHH